MSKAWVRLFRGFLDPGLCRTGEIGRLLKHPLRETAQCGQREISVCHKDASRIILCPHLGEVSETGWMMKSSF